MKRQKAGILKLTKLFSEKTTYDSKISNKTLKEVFYFMLETLQTHDITIPNFGSFTLQERKERTYKNEVFNGIKPKHNIMVFKASPNYKKYIQTFEK